MKTPITKLFGNASPGRVSVMVCLSLVAASALPMLAGATGGMDLSWNSVDGGGYSFSTGGSFGLGGTMGQPDAGSMSGGTFGLTGGFWAGNAAASQLLGHVTWQGRPAQPNALQQLPITLTLKLGITEVNYAAETTDARGFFTVPVGSLPSGTYNWRVKGPKYLANSGSIELTGASMTQAEMGFMRVGDCNNDNTVSAVDFSILRNTFGKAVGDPGYDDRADFTGEQLVNSVDFSLLRNNFGFSGAPPIAPGRGGEGE